MIIYKLFKLVIFYDWFKMLRIGSNHRIEINITIIAVNLELLHILVFNT
jgi:hypothetical protein